ncbi:hypothetical protein AgCh_012079 [Apium graveolens]
MGKKKQKTQENGKNEESKKEVVVKEGENLLGTPKYKKLENGRLKCVETGHELPAHAKDSYAQTKHCRLGLIQSFLKRNKPPLNMFTQDPVSRFGEKFLSLQLAEFVLDGADEENESDVNELSKKEKQISVENEIDNCLPRKKKKIKSTSQD